MLQTAGDFGVSRRAGPQIVLKARLGRIVEGELARSAAHRAAEGHDARVHAVEPYTDADIAAARFTNDIHPSHDRAELAEGMQLVGVGASQQSAPPLVEVA